ncbi:MAG: hypothetical protein L6266_05530, partial [Nanoarchaeota archaeon]|nr:hypothetical protein [Nanoarchaeota archaeon]
KEKIKVSCFVSAFKNKSGFNYRFSIRHRILKDIAQRKEKIMVSRNKKGYFLITRDSKGGLFSLYTNPKGHPLTYLQISPTLITKDELNLFRKGRRSISSKAFLSKEEFNLDISKFFINKEEQTLASALINQNFNIQIPEMRKREADIILQDYNIQIEITRLKPRSISNKNNPHGEGAHINARLCEGFLRVTKGIVPYFFVILHKNWLKYQWVNDLINMVKPKVISIATSFENKWEKDVAESIKNNIKRLNLKK